jgi:hypothetical protein
MTTTITQLKDFLTADYSSVFPGADPVSRFFSLFAHPAVPIVSVALYLLLSDVVCETIRKMFNIQPKGNLLQFITVTHSLALAVYSLWTFVNAFKMVTEVVQLRGFYPTICDNGFDLWDTRNYGFWVTHFYISKYYEFIDTW